MAKSSPKTTTTKATASKAEIKVAQFGRTLKVTVNGEEFSRTGTKETIAPIKELATVAKEKPIKKNVDALLKALKPVTEKKETQKAEIKNQIKKEKKAAPKATKEAPKTSLAEALKTKIAKGEISEAELAEIRGILPAETKKEEQKAPQKTTSRKGEW